MIEKLKRKLPILDAKLVTPILERLKAETERGKKIPIIDPFSVLDPSSIGLPPEHAEDFDTIQIAFSTQDNLLYVYQPLRSKNMPLLRYLARSILSLPIAQAREMFQSTLERLNP